MGDIQDPIVGPRQPVSDGAQVALRSARTGDLVVQPGHGEYYEESARGGVWTISTAIAGVVLTANFVVSVASSNAIVGIYNPTSNINCHITRAVLVQVSGSAVTGGYIWGVIPTPTAITSVGVQARNNKTFIKGGHQAIAFDGSIGVTGSGVTIPFRYFGGFFPGALTAGQGTTFEEVEDDIVVGPGCFAGLFTVIAGTNTTVTGSLSWAEIPA